VKRNESKEPKIRKCQTCQKGVESDGKQCLKCKETFHKKCFEKQKDHMFCDTCFIKFVEVKKNLFSEGKQSNLVQKESPKKSMLMDTSIKSFFRNQKFKPNEKGLDIKERKKEQVYS